MCLGIFSSCSPSCRGGEGKLQEGEDGVGSLPRCPHAAFVDRKTALEKSISPGFRISVLWWCHTTDQIYGIKLTSFRKYFFLRESGLTYEQGGVKNMMGKTTWPELAGAQGFWTDIWGACVGPNLLNVGGSGVAWSVHGIPGRRTRTCPGCMNWLLRVWFRGSFTAST